MLKPLRHHHLSKAMAVAVRCCCVLAGPNSGRICGRSRPSGRPEFSGRLAFPFKVGKFQSCFGDNSTRSTGICSILQPGLGLQDIEITKQGWTCDIDQVPLDDGTITEGSSSGMMGEVVLRFPATAVAVTSALMLTVPFEALAETCESDNSFFNMPLLSFVALIGATVGGLLARQRRGELQRVNEQLRQINAALRRQAKIESYAPALSYAPVGSKIPENEVIIDPKKEELISCLKAGKNCLRNQNPGKAFTEFKTALELARTLNDPIEEKKAARGLGASLQRQGKYRDAIKYHSMVLDISKREGEDSGNTEAYGAIADCYTELGDLERAGKFYDQYIARLEKD